ncbi:MAG: hypothetical protein OXE73_15575 [Gammaproteobacteria bacterium]|nr:hypothetical protein [Gammaproteobacteria bacterium]
MTRSELRARIEAIEESYEFFLAYAAQGASGSGSGASSGQVRQFLARTEEALAGLGEGVAELAETAGLTPASAYRGMAGVLARDAESTLAAVQLVSAQRWVSSQLIDNLNASIHFRALLTDLFLIDEILDIQDAARGGNTPPADG